MENKELMMPLDGNTCFNFNLVANKKGKEIDLFGLTEVCSNLMSIHLGCNCTVPNYFKNIYMGYENNASEKRREFNSKFMGAGFHWCAAELQNGKEKEIDARFDVDVLSAAYRGKIDGVILLTNDRDHRPLAQALKTLKIPTMLIYDEVYENGRKITGYSKELYETCDFKIPLFSFLENPKVFKPMHSEDPVQPFVSAPREVVSAPANKRIVVKRKTTPITQNNAPVQSLTSPSSGSGVYDLRKKIQPTALLQQQIVNAVKQVISDKEQRWNTILKFALTGEVGKYLHKNGVRLPYGQSLSDFFRANPSLFRIGSHPKTGACTVSIL